MKIKINYNYILIFSIIAYAVTMLIFAYPYRMFPSDDTWYYQMIQEGSAFTPDIYNPAILVFLKIISFPWLISNSLTPNILLFHTILSNIITIIFIYLFIREITGKIYFSFLGILLFAASSWTAKYYFFYSYSSFVASLSTILFYMLVKVSSMDMATDRKKAYLISAGAGLIACMCLFSSISSIILITLSFPFFILLCFRRKGFFTAFRKLLLYTAGFSIPTFFFFIMNSFDAYAQHIHENITTYHYDMAYEKFSFIPSIGNFAFFKSLFGELYT